MSFMVYLASRSPRRQQLLRQLGVSFEVCPADVAEVPTPGQSPSDYAAAVALAKARAVLRVSDGNHPVIGADTDVVIDGQILGKPKDRDEALEMLGRLSNRTHEVYSSVAVVDSDRDAMALSVTRVSFGVITRDSASAYWDSGEPDGKAGAYAIQGRGAAFVKTIEGSYSGVVGLPLFETCGLLRQFGIDVLKT